ncbi:MAG: hypothetical protein O7E52_19335 [Candidatus Poribacteria bacterium]|nr:hypothetical protein [Candidatus Poribacteria bacterium]
MKGYLILVVALEHANWKVFGRGGAAELLGVKPTTLVTRIKKMGIENGHTESRRERV